MKPLQNISKFDDIYTPPRPVIDLLPFIDRYEEIWEPAAGKGHIVNVLKNAGKSVWATDIKDGDAFNFFDLNIHNYIDVIVTNPPFSKKDQFLERCIELDKPFALLLPISALSHGRKKTRHNIYKKHGIQIIFLGYRVQFITPSGKKECWFDTAWFTRGLIDETMLFL